MQISRTNAKCAKTFPSWNPAFIEYFSADFQQFNAQFLLIAQIALQVRQKYILSMNDQFWGRDNAFNIIDANARHSDLGSHRHRHLVCHRRSGAGTLPGP
jgi:hypothetical protein